jgi:hypothetical protein
MRCLGDNESVVAISVSRGGSHDARPEVLIHVRQVKIELQWHRRGRPSRLLGSFVSAQCAIAAAEEHMRGVELANQSGKIEVTAALVTRGLKAYVSEAPGRALQYKETGFLRVAPAGEPRIIWSSGERGSRNACTAGLARIRFDEDAFDESTAAVIVQDLLCAIEAGTAPAAEFTIRPTFARHNPSLTLAILYGRMAAFDSALADIEERRFQKPNLSSRLFRILDSWRVKWVYRAFLIRARECSSQWVGPSKMRLRMTSERRKALLDAPATTQSRQTIHTRDSSQS